MQMEQYSNQEDLSERIKTAENNVKVKIKEKLTKPKIERLMKITECQGAHINM